MLKRHNGVTLSDPDALTREGGPYEHLISGIPNTKANRTFWQEVGREMRGSSSRYRLAIRGRGSRKKAGDRHGIPIRNASHFSVYISDGPAAKNRDSVLRDAALWAHGISMYAEGLRAGRRAAAAQAIRDSVAAALPDDLAALMEATATC